MLTASLDGLDVFLLRQIARKLGDLKPIILLCNTNRRLRALRTSLFEVLGEAERERKIPRLLIDHKMPHSLFLDLAGAYPGVKELPQIRVNFLSYAANTNSGELVKAVLRWAHLPRELLLGEGLVERALFKGHGSAALALVKAEPSLAFGGLDPRTFKPLSLDPKPTLYEAVSRACLGLLAEGVDLVREMLAALPDASSRKAAVFGVRDTQETLLHLTVGARVGAFEGLDEIVQLIADAAPAALTTPAGYDSSLPIHRAVQYLYGPIGARIVNILLSMAPETATCINDGDLSPLHLCAIHQGGHAIKIGHLMMAGIPGHLLPPKGQRHGMDIPIVLLRHARSHPEMACQRVPRHGYTPLHYVCIEQEGAESLLFLKALLAVAPNLASMTTYKELLPVELAARYQKGPTVIAFVRELMLSDHKFKGPRTLPAKKEAFFHLIATRFSIKDETELRRLFS